MQGVRVESLVVALRSYMSCGQKTKTQKRSNTVTNSIKPLKLVHIKKSFKQKVGYSEISTRKTRKQAQTTCYNQRCTTTPFSGHTCGRIGCLKGPAEGGREQSQ